MRKYRRRFYNVFSRVYDKFIELHSKDNQHEARKILADQLDPQKDRIIVDLCTGTGSLLPYLGKRCATCFIIGVDFSRGMLQKAQTKIKDKKNICLIEADVSNLPLQHTKCDKIICSHAFYEIKGNDQIKMLNEIKRILKVEGQFIIMEHEIPKNLLIRFLFYLRTLILGQALYHKISLD
jgi:demethylmenaquinone methyltransferase/2-methoxy-6-polyprenyl-1,4-benzoquinol methylase